MGNEGAPLRPSPILTVSLRPESSSFTMSSNKDSAKLNNMQKRKMVTELDDLISQQEQSIVENEADPAVRENALADIKLFVSSIPLDYVVDFAHKSM